MVVAVITNEAAVLVIRREETAGAAVRGFKRERAVVIALDAVGRKEFFLAIELKASGVFFLVSNVWRGSGRHHHRVCRQVDETILRLETYSTQAIAIIDQSFFRTHVFDEGDAFFKSLDDFLVIQPIGR